MKEVLILGNGISRLSKKEQIKEWKGDLWICNWAFQEYRDLPIIRYVGSVHSEVIERAREFREKHNLTFRIISRLDSSDEKFSLDRGWSTGNLFISEALIRDYKKIYLAGFDFGGRDIYQPYPLYGGNFETQYEEIKKVFSKKFERIKFF
jgi:hypothetical protein